MFRKLRVVSLFILLAVCGQAIGGVNESELFGRANTLLEHRRYADARHEFLRLKDVVSSTDAAAVQRVEYGLTVCAVHLNDNVAEHRMKAFLESYPGSVYASDIRFLLALHYCETEDFAAAKKLFTGVSYKSLTPYDRQRYDIRMGYIEFTEGNMAQAMEYFESIPSQSDVADHATYYKSYIHYQNGQLDKAYNGFKSLQNSAEYSKLIPYYLLQIEFERGNYSYVTANCDALLQTSTGGERTAIMRLAAEAWFRLEGYNKALQYITAYAKTAGKTLSREDNYLLGYTAYRTADYAGAVEPLKSVCTGTDNLAQNASYHLADCYIRLGDKRNAIRAFAMAADERYNNEITEDALFNYGKLLFETGGGTFNESINVLARYVNRYPDSVRTPEAKELLIAAYYNSKDYDMAYDAIRSFPNPDGSMKTALQKIAYFKGVEAFNAADYLLAKQSFEESLSIGVSPKYNALCAFWLGEVAYITGDMKQAITQYNYYIKRAPRTAAEYKFALYNLGYSNMNVGDNASAQRALEGFIWLYKSRDAFRADGYNRLGDVHYLQRNYEQAVKNYEGAITVGTEHSHYARYRRAMSLGLLGKEQTKIDALKGIVTTGEGDYVDDAAYELGRTHITAGRYSDGVKVLEALVADYPTTPFMTAAKLNLGLAYFNLGNSDRSLELYDNVISAAPQSQAARDAINSVREIYVSKGDVSSYFAYAERTGVECDLSVVTRDSLSYRTAEKIYLAGKTNESIAHFEEYIKSYPKGYYIDDALFCLSDSYLKCDSLDRALERMKLLSDRPKNRYTVPVLEKLASVTYEHKMYTESASAYRRLYDAVEQADVRRKALRSYVDATLLDAEDNLTLAMVADVESLPGVENSLLRKVSFSKAKVLVSQGKQSEAMDIFQRLSTDKSDAYGAEAAYHIIHDHFTRGNHQTAENLIYELADSKTTHSYYLGRAFIILGDIYAAKGDAFQARATYQSIVDGYTPIDDGVVEQAKQRIQKMM